MPPRTKTRRVSKNKYTQHSKLFRKKPEMRDKIRNWYRKNYPHRADAYIGFMERDLEMYENNEHRCLVVKQLKAWLDQFPDDMPCVFSTGEKMHALNSHGGPVTLEKMTFNGRDLQELGSEQPQEEAGGLLALCIN